MPSATPAPQLVDNAPHCRLDDVEAARQRTLRFSGGIPFADGDNVLNTQFRQWERGTVTIPVLASHVRHIVSMSAHKQMRRVHAARVITCVTDTHSWRNRTVMEFPRDAVSVDASLAASITNLGLARAGVCSGPQPAPVSPYHSFPEAFCQRPSPVYNAWHNDIIPEGGGSRTKL